MKLEFEPPFRWNIARRQELGSLITGEPARDYPIFYEQLLKCCAGVLSYSGDSDLVFVGRSPESIFDHLSGLLCDTSWSDRLQLLHFSMRNQEESMVRRNHPKTIMAMRSYFKNLGIDPESVSTSRNRLAFVDLVATGDTFGRLIRFLHSWTDEMKFDWQAVRRRIRLVGITQQKKSSPNTWRWQQHAAWISLMETNSVRNVSIPPQLWDYLGNYQDKVSPSYRPSRWGATDLANPSRSEENLRALRMAFNVFELGRKKETRTALVSHLVKTKSMREVWMRNLVTELR